MSAEMTDKERELTERNERLAATLREARDALMAGKDAIDGEAKRAAIAESLDYVIIAVDMRIDLLRRSIGSGRVGTETDEARRIAGSALANIFEAALRGHGYRIVADPLVE